MANAGVVFLRMPILVPAELRRAVTGEHRLLGLDLGSKTIGMALTDTRRVIATPMATLQRRKFTQDATELFALIDKHDVGGVVLGLPVSLDGSEGPACQSVRSFGSNLLGLRDIPLSFWDERLSTSAVTRILLEADASRKRRAALVDKMAAAYILQGLLDATAS